MPTGSATASVCSDIGCNFGSSYFGSSYSIVYSIVVGIIPCPTATLNAGGFYEPLTVTASCLPAASHSTVPRSRL
jgi:hypothetical protein